MKIPIILKSSKKTLKERRFAFQTVKEAGKN
jgi:hypothetical protein